MWPLLIIAGSALLQHAANQQAVARQNRFRQAMEAYQRQRAAESEAATQGLIAKQTPKERETENQQVIGEREQSLRDTVGAAQAFDAKPIAGKLSQDYRSAQEAAANTVAERTKRAIEQLARMGAPGEVQQRFGLRYGRAAGDVDAANRAISNVGQGYLSDINQVRPNQFATLASQIGMGVGMGMAGAPSAAGAGAAGYGTAEEAAALGIHGPQFVPTTPSSSIARAFSLWGRS